MNLQERIVADGYEGEEPILFYHPKDEFGFFSNFSRHSVPCRNPWTDKPQMYRTGEHRYQAMKAMSENNHDWVALAPGAFEAKERGGPRGIELRAGWGESYGDLCYYVMLELCTAKAHQYDHIFNALDNSGDRPIYEDSPTDDIWGVRFQQDYRGKNLLGRCWMQVRKDIREALYL